jgi:hypothetical protein
MATFIEFAKDKPLIRQYIGKAGEDLSAFTYVKIHTDDTILTATDTSTKGIIEEDFSDGDDVYAVTEGPAHVMAAAGGITAGMEVTSNASGKVIQNTGANGGGVAWNASSSADDVIIVYVKPKS